MRAANDNVRVCPQCGSPVTKRAGTIYCSDSCRSKAGYERIGRQQAYSVSHTCQRCGVSFIPSRSDRTKFCSRDCSYAFKSEHAKGPKPYEPIKHAHMCVVCGGSFESRHPMTPCCGEACQVEHNRRRWRQYANDNHKPSERQCAECGTLFMPDYASKRRVYCSDECRIKASRRAAKHIRRARLKAGTSERVYAMLVFERDQWRCKICGIDTPRILRGTWHDQAPELDHVVPLAAGGPHTYDNTQCACRRCNGIKGSQILAA